MANPLQGYVPDYDNDEHSPWSPSGAAAWLRCPAWPLKNWQKNSSSAAAEEGTRLHKIGEELLNGASVTQYSDEDVKMVIGYVRYCSDLDIEFGHMVEGHINLSHYGLPGIFGTADYWARGKHKLEVVDLKTGYHKVDPDTPQGKIYLLGAAGGGIFGYSELTFTIHQHGEARSQSYTPFELLVWLQKTLRPAYEATLEDHPVQRPGETQCQWCAARGSCLALAEQMTTEIEETFRPYVPSPEELSPEEVAKILNASKQVKSWIDAVEGHAKDLIVKGIPVPGFKLVEGRRSRAWKDEAEAEKWIGRKVRKEDKYTVKFKSPAQIEKVIDKRYKKQLADLIEVKPGKPTLAPEDDKRPAISGSAQLEFANAIFNEFMEKEK